MGPIKVDRSAVAEQKNSVGGDSKSTNGTTPKKPVTAPLHLDTKLTDMRVTDSGPSSPGGSSGAMTPTGFHKIHTRSGVRNQQDSGFKISGEQIDDQKGNRASIKVHNPPGGKSSGLW